MNVDEAIKAYEEKFGGLPLFLLMGASDEVIAEKLSACLETGRELEPDDTEAEY